MRRSLRRVPVLFFLLLLLPPDAARAQRAVVPDRSVAGIRIGMPRAGVWKHVGKPTGVPLLHTAGRYYAWDNWQDDRRRETVISAQGRVVQVEHRVAPSPDQTFLSIRREHPHLRVTFYDLTEEVGGVLVMDDVRQGVAWTFYVHHKDDPGIHLFNEIGPDMVIRHRCGRPLLPDAGETFNEHDPLVDDARAWFAPPQRHKGN